MFENLSLPHLLIVVAVAMLIFGPKRLPEIGASLGKGIREFRKSIVATRSDVLSGLSDSTMSEEKAATMSQEKSGQSAATVPAGSGEPKRLLD